MGSLPWASVHVHRFHNPFGMQLCFAVWKSTPELDPDIAYRNYLENTLATDARREFDLARMEFVVRLRRGPFWRRR